MTRLVRASQAPDSAEALKFKTYLGYISDESLATAGGKEFSEQASSWAASIASNAEWITGMLPTFMRLYPHSGSDGGAMLAALNQYAVVNRVTMVPFHSVMADHWPAAGQGAPDYDPAAIFESARNFMNSHPNQPGAAAIIHSMEAMSSFGIAGEVKDVSDVAFRFWLHDRAGASGVIKKLKGQFDSSRVTTLLANLPLADEAQMEAVTTTLHHVALLMTPKVRLEATLTLLGRPAIPSGPTKDIELQLWFAALADQADATISAALLDEKLTEGGYERLMGTMLSETSRYQPNTFVQLIDRAASEGWNLASLVDAGTLLERMLGGPADLSERLLGHFLQETSDARKKRLAELLKFTAPDRYLRTSKVDERLAEGDRAILERVGHKLKRRRA